MKRIRKIALFIFVLLMIICISGVSQAFKVYRETAVGVIVDGHFYPNTNFPGGTFFCIQPGGEFHVSSLMTQAEEEAYPVETYIPASGYQCEDCSAITLPWANNSKYYYNYEAEETFSFYQYPDAAYVLAEMMERGGIINWETAFGIWNSRLSNPIRIGDYSIIEESKAYDEFFKTIHGGYTPNDIFETLIHDNTSNVDVGVNQDEDSYTVGPFRISYPDGVYNGQNKFSWIESLEAVTNTGILPAKVLLSSGQEINISELGENGSQTINNKNFYIKFYSTTATEVMLKVTFGYLEHCDATMTKYTGKRVYRNWEKEAGNEKCDEHGYYRVDYYDSNGFHVQHDWQDNLKDKVRYKAIDVEGSASQILMALSGDASKVRKTVTKYFTGVSVGSDSDDDDIPGDDDHPGDDDDIPGDDDHPGDDDDDTPIDLTMKLAGTVFLDQDTGKVNTGNNKLDAGEGLAGVEVTLYESNGNEASLSSPTMHNHTGSPIQGTGCYTIPVYHTHVGSETSYGACYSEAIHEHTGSKEYGTGCYRVTYHTHTPDCYSTGGYHHHELWCYSEIVCNKRTHRRIYTSNGSVSEQVQEREVNLRWEPNAQSYITDEGRLVTRAEIMSGMFTDGYEGMSEWSEYFVIGGGSGELRCGRQENEYVGEGALTCNLSTTEPEGYEIVCGQQERYRKTCNKDEHTIDYYKTGCNITPGTIDGQLTPRARTLTDSSGNYAFYHLNSQKKYYVKFVYNGMLYTNVERLAGNADNISKATEEAQGHSGNRQSFNDQFKHIGSNPNNYESRSRGAYNQVFLQEEIADTFKNIATNFGGHGNTDKEVYAYDCRISAYSTEMYPLINVFTPDYSWKNIAGQNYNPIYNGAYSQLHVNLGIKARPTFDLALYKDVFKATLNINGKEEVYTYDARKDWQNQGFSYGVNEDYYLNELRDKYMAGRDPNITTKETINEGQYSHEYRTEEIINGNNTNENYQQWLHQDSYKNTLYGADSNKNYAWRQINHQVSPEDRLQIHVTYKIAIRNQSNVVGSVTEIVDYYDGHYQFENAYVGDVNGNKLPTVNGQDLSLVYNSENPQDGYPAGQSMYGEQTRMGANGQWTVGSQRRGYKTIYLRPTEKVLSTDDKEQYIYVTFGLIEPEATLVNAGLPQGATFYTYNLAEINGYKTYVTNEEYKENLQYYQTHKEELARRSMGLVDRDSNPGNFDPSIYNMGITPLEDDTSKAPAYAYSIRTSRTLEGNVFEDANTGNASRDKYEVLVNKTRFGNGLYKINGNQHVAVDDMFADKDIKDVKVELVEIKNGQLVSRQETRTDEKGWYGFGAFLPGDYTIRFTYGADDKTALTKTSQYSQGSNDTSYNGQDYQSTTFTTKQGETVGTHTYKVDTALQGVYNNNNSAKNREESNVLVEDQKITKYERENYYWFDDANIANRSDATDDVARRDKVNAYAKSEYGRAITNHKAEVFNSYINQLTLRNAEKAKLSEKAFNTFTQAQPTEEVVDNATKNRELVNELERRTYMYAYTPEINVEVEYTTKQIGGNLNQTKPQGEKDYYQYKIVGVDFGVVERPRAQLTIDQDIKHVKVTASDGTTLLELNNNNGSVQVIVDNGNNYQWLNTGKFGKYDQDELINIILDDELLSGAKLEVTYNITVANNSEVDTSSNHQTDNKTRAVNIINYVANNLNFDLIDNKDAQGRNLWEVVKKEDIQTSSHATWINNENRNSNTKIVDLSTQTTVLKATRENPLTKELKPGETTEATLTLKKTLSAESSSDDLSYANLTEIVEIDNVVGRYDHGAIPGNQNLEEQPREHDTSGASRYDEIDEDAGTKDVKKKYPPDGKIIVTPPTGSTHIYYILGTVAAVILLVGVALIKKFVIDKRK